VRERFGSYEIYEELGAGGLASVHLARSPAIKNPVALKRMYPHIASIPELVASFVDEARLARYLQHPGIARIYEYGRMRGTYFIAFEFVPGPTLQQLQRHCEAHVGRIPVPIVMEIAYQLCDALDHAHTLRDRVGLPLGIVHRDVSPSNVIVSSTGLVKLIDFGLAKSKQQTAQSQAGVLKGKLSYVAPEYLAGKLDARCDLWALGVCLHELLTGRRLFDAPEQGTILERVQVMPIPPPSRFNPEVSPAVDQLILRALEREPARRWPSAAAMRSAIAAAVSYRLTQQQMVAWVEWAFSQKQPQAREDSAVSMLHEIIESKQTQVPGQTSAMSEAMEERRRASLAMMPLVDPTAHRSGSGRWVWITLILVILAIGGGLVIARQLGAI